MKTNTKQSQQCSVCLEEEARQDVQTIQNRFIGSHDFPLLLSLMNMYQNTALNSGFMPKIILHAHINNHIMKWQSCTLLFNFSHTILMCFAHCSLSMFPFFFLQNFPLYALYFCFEQTTQPTFLGCILTIEAHPTDFLRRTGLGFY